MRNDESATKFHVAKLKMNGYGRYGATKLVDWNLFDLQFVYTFENGMLPYIHSFIPFTLSLYLAL